MNTLEKKICTCYCHRDGLEVRHCMPCCVHTYKKYISKDGEFDEERFQQLNKNPSQEESSI